MNPITLLLLFVGLLLVWYAFTGNSPIKTLQGVLPGGTKTTATGGGKPNGS